MPAVDLAPTPAVQLAWKIAAAAARSSGSSIEVAHFLYGIFNLPVLPVSQMPADSRDQVLEEIAAIEQALTPAGVTSQDLRRSLRSVLPQKDAKVTSSSGTVSRSEAVRKAFEQAAAQSVTGGPARIGLVDLTRTLLLGEPSAASWLGLNPGPYQSLLTALGVPDAFPLEDEMPDMALEGISIFQSIDAEAVHDGKVDWATIGEHFGLMCELAWQGGTSARVEPLLASAVDILLKAISGAEHAAILLLDEFGDLMLKAHAPRGALTVSTSSAMKAINQRKSFIWQRGEDLSASQLESDLRAGLYAPILASGEVFGVICLDAQSAALHFSHNDLYLATSLGHQLGLTLANRRREEDLCRTAQSMERLLTNFSPQVRDRLLTQSESGRLKPGAERSIISILTANIQGFSQRAAEMDAQQVVSMLNDYLSAIVAVIFKHGGTVDKFSGDSLMAVFGSPEADAMHPEQCARAAIEIQSEIQRVSAERTAARQQSCAIGIGAHTGEVVHGFIGSLERMDFTVIGSPVALAMRLCDAAQPGDIILSQELLEKVWKDAVVESVDVPTRDSEPIPAFRLLKMRPPKQLSR